ncbi:MAG: radical SAM/Cys-rich domain protein [bacterium]|nr:MAG: radical SAM/Cys-rich domain protein [bacterium]HEC27438.1 radical SAM/Cys-rich domain protein [Gammaproteobacteria bacterium]
MLATLPLLEETDFPDIKREKLEILQVNLGYLCNQSCLHCHVDAGPNRKEQMNRQTVDDLIKFLQNTNIRTLDITGGAPEINEHFRYLVKAARRHGVRIIDRCNLTILNEPGQEDLAEFLASHRVEVVASLPCYLKDNVDAQRGKGVYRSSITGLHKLNALGYGKPGTGLTLNLMYNPQGPSLPPPQDTLEADYKRELQHREGVEFNSLFVLVNMPIKRFGSMLISKGQFHEYMQLLKDTYKASNLKGIMCRTLISVDWQGYVYDCDFNQMLELPLLIQGRTKTHINQISIDALMENPIVIRNHCYGCTAGQGCSCSGAL